MAPVSEGEDLVSRARSIFARLRDDQTDEASDDVPTNGASPDHESGPEPEPVADAHDEAAGEAVTAASVEWSDEAAAAPAQDNEPEAASEPAPPAEPEAEAAVIELHPAAATETK